MQYVQKLCYNYKAKRLTGQHTYKFTVKCNIMDVSKATTETDMLT